tara:strand:- start:54 stop:284 length:231 start_codon:yes stop_codon:yes gene_type:complete
MKHLLNHLLKTYSKQFLFELFGIKSDTWRQHKVYVSSEGKKGQVLSPSYYLDIKTKYLEHLRDKVSEVSDIDSNLF